MLTIRKKNQIALSEEIGTRREGRLTRYILARFPHVLAGDEQAARAIVEKGDASAKEYGITNEDDVALFIDMGVMYGDDFHREPWAFDVLTSDKLTSREKVLELRDRIFRSGALM